VAYIDLNAYNSCYINDEKKSWVLPKISIHIKFEPGPVGYGPQALLEAETFELVDVDLQ